MTIKHFASSDLEKYRFQVSIKLIWPPFPAIYHNLPMMEVKLEISFSVSDEILGLVVVFDKLV